MKRKVLPRYIDSIKVTEMTLAKKPYLELTINENVQVYYNKDNSIVEDIQDMINKGAYASAINYLNLNSTLLIESGFEDIIDSESKVKDFYEDCENLLKECTYKTTEQGKPFTSLLEGCNVLEGNKNLIREQDGVRVVEDFRNNLTESDLDKAIVVGIEDKAIRVVTESCEVYDILVEKEKLYNQLNGERNKSVFKRMKIKESHKVGYSDFDEAYKDSEPVAINGLDIENGQVVMTLINKYNQIFKRVINLDKSDLTPEQFIEPYQDTIEEIKAMDDFEDAVQKSKPILDDLDSYATGYKRKSYQGDENRYKAVKEYIDDLVPVDVEVYDEKTLRVILTDKDGKMYSVLYERKEGSNIEDLDIYADDLAIDIYEIVDKTPDYETAYEKSRDIMLELEYEFVPGRKTRATDWGDYEWGQVESVQEEGTQTSDIAPKTDYFDNEKKELLLSNVDEEEICMKGFLRNTDGYYQRGNYLLVKENEQFRVIHKNKLRKEV